MGISSVVSPHKLSRHEHATRSTHKSRAPRHTFFHSKCKQVKPIITFVVVEDTQSFFSPRACLGCCCFMCDNGRLVQSPDPSPLPRGSSNLQHKRREESDQEPRRVFGKDEPPIRSPRGMGASSYANEVFGSRTLAS